MTNATVVSSFLNQQISLIVNIVTDFWRYIWGLDYQNDGKWSGYTKWDFCVGIFSEIFSTYLGSLYLKYISNIIRYSKFKVD